MRSNATEYELVAPGSLSGVLEALADGTCQPMAGGTELMVALCAGRLPGRRFVSLNHLQELRYIDSSDLSVVRIGSGTTFHDIRQSTVLTRELPLLAQTASWTGSIANQNRGTIGGNLANASPAADNPPALLAYEAQLRLVSARGARTIAYRDFHLGYKQTALAPGEIIESIILPLRFADHVHWVRKVGTRNAQAIAKIALAGVAQVQEGRLTEVALGAASLLDRPMRLARTEATLLHQSVRDVAMWKRAQDALRSEVSPISDIRSTAKYRTQVAANLLEEFLQHCAEN